MYNIAVFNLDIFKVYYSRFAINTVVIMNTFHNDILVSAAPIGKKSLGYQIFYINNKNNNKSL